MTKTILVIDDSSSLRTLARLTLEKAGHTVVEACDGRDALGKLGTVQPDLIVCDLHMPNMDGLEFAHDLRAMSLHRFTPVVMLTTALDPKKKASAREAGISAWINKPFDSRSLLDAVERLCK